MTAASIHEAAEALWGHWQHATRLGALPASLRPADRAAGYAIQARVAEISGQRVSGWKIAATSAAGQAHLKVDGPLAGRLLDGRVVSQGATVSLTGNSMTVAEAEFAFRLGRDLPPRHHPYVTDQAVGALEALHTAIEVPDSRFDDFTIVGAPQLIADNACASWFVLGPEVEADWRRVALDAHEVQGFRNGTHAATGRGSNVLGSPLLAMTWIANELRLVGPGLRAGDVVTTGTCLAPIAVTPGDRVTMDYGEFGTIDAAFD